MDFEFQVSGFQLCDVSGFRVSGVWFFICGIKLIESLYGMLGYFRRFLDKVRLLVC